MSPAHIVVVYKPHIFLSDGGAVCISAIIVTKGACSFSISVGIEVV